MLLNLQAKSNSITLLSKFTIYCAKLMLGVLAGNDSIKKYHKNVWASKWCHICIMVNNFKSKIGLGWFISVDFMFIKGHQINSLDHNSHLFTLFE